MPWPYVFPIRWVKKTKEDFPTDQDSVANKMALPSDYGIKTKEGLSNYGVGTKSKVSSSYELEE